MLSGLVLSTDSSWSLLQVVFRWRSYDRHADGKENKKDIKRRSYPEIPINPSCGP